MTESAGPRFGSESSRKIIEVRRQSKLIINHFRGVPGDGCHRPRCRRNVSPTDIEVESVTAKHGSNPPPGRDRAEGEGEMNKPSTRPAAPATTQAHCNTCRGTRKHDVLFSKRKHWDDSVDGGRHSISGTDTYSLIACGGCETIHLKHDSTFSEDTELDGSSIVTTNYYPPATSRRTPTWLGSKNSPFWYGDTVIEQWLKEIYSAVQNDSRRLAVMGIRSLLETVRLNIDALWVTALVATGMLMLLNTF
jgi:hypothetical protein